MLRNFYYFLKLLKVFAVINLMRNIVVERLNALPIEKQRIEVVERKGIGHPDYICDAIAERVSVELSKVYMKRFGAVLHHNIDKIFLAAGEAEQRFGGGVITKPMLLVFGDRATYEVEGERIDVDAITIDTAKKWLNENLRFLDVENHVKYQVELKQVSTALADIFKRGGDVLPANDTSVGVGYAPFSRTERIALELERFLNSREFKQSFPYTGEDVKVMASRIDENVDIIIAMPLIDRFIENESDYFRKKEEVMESIKEFVSKNCELKTNILFNALDSPGRGLAGCYLTITGTCAENADSGEVGRGNRVNGLIPLNRPVSNEAAAGKNPVSHVGKIYNVLSNVIAREIQEKVSGIEEVYVWLLSQIGQPISHPKLVSVQIVGANIDETMKKEAREIVEKRLDSIKQFCTELAEGKYRIY